MSTHNIGFYKDLTKIVFELSSNTHLFSSAVVASFGGITICMPMVVHSMPFITICVITPITLSGRGSEMVICLYIHI